MTEHEMAQIVFEKITRGYFLNPASKLFARVAAEDAAKEIMRRQELERERQEQRRLRSRTVTVKRTEAA